MSPLPQGCHLVGSISLPDTETVFRECIARLPGRLKCIPDAETGNRSYFTAFQFAVFSSMPQCMAPFKMDKAAESKDIDPAEIEENISKLPSVICLSGQATTPPLSQATLSSSASKTKASFPSTSDSRYAFRPARASSLLYTTSIERLCSRSMRLLSSGQCVESKMRFRLGSFRFRLILRGTLRSGRACTRSPGLTIRRRGL